MRSRRLRTGEAALILALALAAWAPQARAENANLSMLQPTADPRGIFGVDSARPLPHLTIHAALNTHYANDELVARLNESLVSRPIYHRVISELTVGMALWERVDLSLSLPVVLRQVSEHYPGLSQTRAESGLSDLRITPRVHLVRNRCAGHDLGVAVVADVGAPTGTREQLMGDAGWSFAPRAALDYCHGGSGVEVALNLGYRHRKDSQVGNLTVGDELQLGLGAEAPLGALSLSVLAEVRARFGLGTDDSNPDIFVQKKIPVEAAGGLRWRHGSGFIATLGAGGGLTSGYGAPDLRVFLGLGYVLPLGGARELRPEPLLEQLARRKDPKPKAGPREVPPRAADVPAAGGATPMSAEAFAAAVAKDPDPDGDGLVGAADRCPAEAEDRDGFQDADGCPELDNDRDGVPDAQDRCPLKREVINGVDDDDGCPDKGVAKVQVTRTKVEITERVFFETGSDQLKEASVSLLKQVAGVLKASWWLRKVRVEGHTDDRGDKEMNVDLSERRARRVLSFLEAQGVARHRLSARGYGPTRPLESNRSRAGRSKNRRVEFTILERAPQGGAK